MKHFIILLTLCLVGKAQAQPTLNNAENFIIGTTLKFINCSTVNVSPGSTGPNQVWDYTSLGITTDTSTEWIISPASAPEASLFPTANQVEKYSDGRYVYVNKTATNNLLVGFYDPSITIKYPMPINFMQRPLSYNDNITSYFTSDYTVSGYSFKGNGTVTINADSYGTLLLPNGTFSNTLKVKISQVQVDTLIQFQSTYTTVSTTYAWFDNAHTSALFKIDTVGSSSYNGKTVAFLLNETVSGVQEREKIDPVRIYPNPASNSITIQNYQGQNMTIINNIGERVFYKCIENQKERIELPNLKPGNYHVIIESGLSKHTGKLIIK